MVGILPKYSSLVRLTTPIKFTLDFKSKVYSCIYENYTITTFTYDRNKQNNEESSGGLLPCSLLQRQSILNQAIYWLHKYTHIDIYTQKQPFLVLIFGQTMGKTVIVNIGSLIFNNMNLRSPNSTLFYTLEFSVKYVDFIIIFSVLT